MSMKRNRWGNRLYALFMTAFMVLSLLPASNLQVQAEEDQTVETETAGNTETAGQPQSESDTFEIRYVANGGQGDMDFQTFQSDDAEVQLTANGFTLEGHEFQGWSTTPDGEDVISQGEVDMPARFVPDESILRELEYDWDADEDGIISEEETFSLSDCIRDNTLVLYAQWEKLPEEDEPGQTSVPEEKEPVIVDITSDDLQELTEASEISKQEMLALRNNLPTALLDENDNPVEPENPKSEGDGTKINSVKVSWIDEPAGTTQKTVDLTGKNNAPFNVRMQLELTLSGQNNYDAGTIQIRIPKQIMRNRDGNLVGEMSLSVPEAPDDRATFAYTDMEDYYLLTNTRALPASLGVYFEFTISKMVPNTIPENTDSDPFTATVSVETPNHETLISKPKEDLTFQIRTNEQLTASTKQDNGVYLDWPAEWDRLEIPKPKNAQGEEAPDDYVYIDWYTYVRIYGNQNFSLKFMDDPSQMKNDKGEYKNIDDYQILGYRYNNTYQIYDPEAGATLTENEWQADGDRYFTHVYVAYNRKNFPLPDEWNTRVVYTVKNTIEYTLKGVDKDETAEPSKSSVSDEAQIAFVPFYIPRGQFNVWKTGNGGDRYTNYWTPDTFLSTINYYSYGLNELLDKGQTDLSYKVRLEGFGYRLTYGGTDESGKTLDPENPDSYGKKSYAFDITDDRLYWDDSTNLNNYKVDDTRLLDEDYYGFKSLTIQNPTVYDYVKFQSSQNGYRYDENGHIIYGTVTAGDYGFMANADPKERPDLVVYGKRRKSDEWTEMAVYSYNGRTEAKDNCQISNNIITFTQPVAAYRVVARTKKAGLIWEILPTVTLKGTDGTDKTYVRDYVLDKMENADNVSIPLSNVVSSKILDNEGKVILSSTGKDDPDGNYNNVLEDKKGNDILQGASLGVRASKVLQTTENDPANKEVKLTYRLNVDLQSNLSNRNSYNLAQENNYLTKETKGTFYDLLPAHVMVDLNSLKLRTGDQITSVEQIPNYKDSGRTLLIVKANLAPNPGYRAAHQSVTGMPGYCDTLRLTYDAYITWVDMVDFGKHLENNFVYESGNTQLGSLKGYMGEPDDPRGGQNAASISGAGTAIEYLKDINSQNDNNAYVYAKSNDDLVVDVSGHTFLSKYVSVNNDGRYVTGQSATYPTKAYVGGAYTYRLRMENGNDTISKDLVFFDKLETFTPNETMGKEFQDELNTYGRWQGHLLSVDTSEAESLGIDPKVYWSEIVDLDLNAEASRNLANTAIWQPLKADTDKSKVKAIAVDLSKTEKGEDFELKAKSSVNVFVNMKAPSETELGTRIKCMRTRQETDAEGNIKEVIEAGSHAYNDVHLSANVKAVRQGAELPDGSTAQDEGSYREMYLNYQYTRLALVPLDIEVHKTWDDADNQDGYRPEAVKVRLLANNQPMDTIMGSPEGEQRYTAVLSEKNGWYTCFENVPPVDSEGKSYYFSFEELPATDADGQSSGNLSKYSVSWSSKPGYREITDKVEEQTSTYKVETKDYTLTNYHKPEELDITGTKFWDDDSDAQHQRPNSVDVALYADGEKIAKRTTNAANGWAYTFANMPKNRNGEPIRYEVKEDAYYPGYYSKVDGYNLTNTFDPIGHLAITKTVKNGTSKALEKEFTFTATFYSKSEQDGDRGPVIADGFTAEKVDHKVETIEELEKLKEGSGEKFQIHSGDKFRLKAGETLVVYDLPSETDYVLEEQDQPGFTLTSQSNTESDIRARQISQAEFENTYNATGSLNFTARKVVENHAVVNHLFRFELLDEDKQTDTEGKTEEEIDKEKVIRTTSNDKDGNVQFGSIRFSLADLNGQDSSQGTRHFLIREIQGDAAGYSYTKDVYAATVELQDDGDGTITPTVTYRKNNGEETTSETPVFTNVYTADGSVEIKAWKKITGRELKENEFTFNLYKYAQEKDGETVSWIPVTKETEDGQTTEVLAQVQNQKDGTILFAPTVNAEGQKDTDSPLYFTQEDIGKTFRFKVKETEGKDETVDYNTNALVYEVVVYDDNNGTLSFDSKFIGREKTVKAEDGTESLELDETVKLPVIENDLKDGSLKITKAVTSGDPNTDFKFKIRFEYPEGKDLGEDVTIKREPVTSKNVSVNVFAKDGGPIAGVTYDLFWIPADGTSEVKIGTYTTDDSGYGGVIGLDGSQYQNGHFEARLKDWDKSSYSSLEDTYQFEEPEQVSDVMEYTWNLEMEEADLAYAVVDKTNRELVFYRGSQNYIDKLKSQLPETRYEVLENFEKTTTSPWKKYNDSIDVIRCEGVIQPGSSMANWFSGMKAREIHLEQFDTSQVISLNNTFNGCRQAQVIDLTGWNVSNVTNMQGTFYYCEVVEDLAIEDWDVSKVTTMHTMFDCAHKLKPLDLSRWQTDSLTNLTQTFRNCFALSSLNVSTWNTSKVTAMRYAFSDCLTLQELDLSNWSINCDTTGFFEHCQQLKKIKFSNSIKFSGDLTAQFGGGTVVTDVSYRTKRWEKAGSDLQSTLNGFVNLTSSQLFGTWVREDENGELHESELDLESKVTVSSEKGFSLKKATSVASKEGTGESGIQTVSDGETRPFTVTQDMSGMAIAELNRETGELVFYRIKETVTPVNTNKYLYFSGFESGDIHPWNDSTYTMSRIKSIRFESPIQPVGSIDGWFMHLYNLVSFDGKNFDLTKVNRLNQLFRRCSSLEHLDLSTVKTTPQGTTSSLLYLGWMFEGCAKLKTVKLNNWNTSGALVFDCMFYNCSSLTEIDLTDISTRSLKTTQYGTDHMFTNCNSLKRVVFGPDFSFNGFKSNVSISVRGSLPNPPQNSIYTEKWCKEDDPSVAMTASEMSAYSGSITGTWIWQPAETAYAVSYDANGGSGSMPTKYANINESLQLDACTFVRPGYDFAGWKDAHGKSYEEIIPAETQKGGSLLKLYAQWKPSGFLAGGEGEYEIILKGNQTALIPGIPAGTKYTIYEETPDGWKLLSSSGTTGEIESLKTAEAVFRNQYEPGSASAIITANKILEGGTLQDGQFEFGLYAVNGEQETLISTARNMSTGQIVFPQIVYKGGAEGADPAGTYTYRIRELTQTDENIICDSETYEVNVVLIDNKDGTRTASAVLPDITFRNSVKKPLPTTGSLTIQKTVQDSYDGQTLPEFTVEVTIDGQIQELKLKAGKDNAVRLDGLPIGAMFSITETDIPEGFSFVETVNGSGIVAPGENYATVINKYTGKRPEATVMLEAAKELKNGTQENGQFSFTLFRQKKTSESSEPEWEAVETVTNTADGKILFSPLTFTTAGSWTYKVVEQHPTEDQNDGTIDYDTSEKTVTVKVEQQEDDSLTPTVTWSDSDNTFHNAMKPGTLTVTKHVENGTGKTAQQDFTFCLTDPDGNPLSSINWTKGEGETAQTGTLPEDGSFTLKDGETIAFALPNGTAYKVTEQEATGYVTTATGDAGTIQSNTVSETVFTNTYSAKGVFEPKAKKTLLGRPLEAGQFTFLLQNEENEIIQEVKNLEDGSVTFHPIEFTLADLENRPDVKPDKDKGETEESVKGIKEFTYYMMEKTPDDSEIISDQNIVTIKVRVSDTGTGELKVEPHYYVGETEIASITFTNRAAVELPAAGRTGSWIGYAAGAAALGASAFVLLDNRRKKSKK